MSQLVTVRIKEGVFVSQYCLEKALEELGLSFVTIEQAEAGHYSISLSKEGVRQGSVKQVRNTLQTSAKSIVEQVQPVYVRILTIHNLTQKGFKEKKKSTSADGQKIILEREKALKDGGGFERIEVTIHNNNTVTLDHHNFVGRTCLRTTEKLVGQLGSVVKREMKKENQTNMLKAKNENRNRLRI